MEISIKYDENGLVPAIVQDYATGKVLTLAYMNEVALVKTLETGETWFYSRSRKELWNKGETSGNKQIVKNISVDCDQDALVVQVQPLGPACHKGTTTCFETTLSETEKPLFSIVNELTDKIKDRKENPQEGAYTTYLFNKGLDKILKKIGEESTEVVIGAKNNDKEELTNELADLLYHSLVLMEEQGVSSKDIKKILNERHIEKEGQHRE
ncbi:histidine biosynthesis bifunctional protein HisIE [Oceanobacillus oncorhynchi subsp. incaldanensis]|uniref:Histidine biosynthesis bifunctional protein HisIE n=2 Tax=Oceanobacillus TaxID=182709 RepID=A0A0A1MH86_9BACI|nr:bifunctional phosphoribosyl-AMP cyclohydrolase/phosphoribosyl-ATP diphosphatase HisIE [Oceanobacillus oncorhynchi]MDM8100189.1 bifunctional phosphoribosyl-AMP cyclohydrolase/phosphoribosyl-ATP diphosphatase HisIE [Oceanobacillus oncorhynchi]UUI40992.1 bifunctional phosphoribosyl-AMP cyclohydrolase/phosphoribosyl-ATP diphosphatase HisIE [Oceanobacillus oncorhynchi]GIO19888.1 histidine biosynthesis bifunctional protein HisIE [Oceanobacillus oncorhynchi subsp. incaldanensis]CEI82438.1 Phosphori